MIARRVNQAKQETAIQLLLCNSTPTSSSKSASLDLDNVLGDGQTPGDLIVSFTDGEPHWSEGFTASIDCEQDGYCNATAEITYPDDPNTLQRSVSTEFSRNPDTVHNADDWIVEDIADTRNQITLETVASSSVGGNGDYDEIAMADITFDDIQLQVCGDDNNDDEIVPPVALDDGNNDLPVCSSFDPIDINVLDNDNDPNGDSLSIDNVSSQTNVSCQTVSFPQISSDNCRGGVY